MAEPVTPLPPLSAEEMATFLAYHAKYHRPEGGSCADDGMVWPCPTARLLAHVEAQEARLVEYKAALDRSREGWRERITFAMEGPHHNENDCPTWYDGCNCGIVLRLQAQLVEREARIAELEKGIHEWLHCPSEVSGDAMLAWMENGGPDPREHRLMEVAKERDALKAQLAELERRLVLEAHNPNP